MDEGDYYAGETVTLRTVYNVGRGVRSLQVVATKSINPLNGALAVTAAWGSIWGLINYRRYKKGKMQKREAVAATASEAAGLGLASGLGLFISNLLRSSLLVVSTSSLLPFTVGVATTAGAKTLWDLSMRPAKA